MGAWAELRQRGDVEFAVVALPPGLNAVLAEQGDVAAILVSDRLTPTERAEAVLHELRHLDRGGSGWRRDLPESMRPLVAREEERVDRLVADELLPRERLVDLIERRAPLEAITAHLVAEECGVSLAVAERQLRALTG